MGEKGEQGEEREGGGGGEEKEGKEGKKRGELPVGHLLLISLPPTKTAESFLFIGWREEGKASDPVFARDN